MKLSNEIKVGLLAIIALVILVLGYNYLKGINLLSGQESYYATYDKINGLLTANPVTVNGFRVGIVNDIQMLQDGTGRLRVEYLIDREIKIPKGSKASIMADGFLGDMMVALEYPEKQNTQFHQPKEELIGSVAPGLTDMLEGVQKELEPYQAKIDDIVKQLDSTVRAVKNIVTSERVQNIIKETEAMVGTVKGTLEGANKLVRNVNGFIEKDMNKVSTILANTENLTNNLNQEMSKISPILDDTKQAVSKINPIMDDAKQLVQKVSPIMDNAKQLVQKINPMMDDARKITSGAKQLMDKDLKQITADVQAITSDAKVMTNKFKGMTGDLEKIASNAGSLTEEAKSITADAKKLTAQLTAADIPAMLQDGKQTIAQLNGLISKIENGEGSVGQLMNDEALYQEITTLSEEAGSLTKSLNHIVKDIEADPHGYFSLIRIGDGSRKKRRQERKEKRRAEKEN